MDGKALIALCAFFQSICVFPSDFANATSRQAGELTEYVRVARMKFWTHALALAEQTPPERNRYVDFLRAASILFVISGHWLIASFFYQHGRLEPDDILGIQPWTQWLSWIFQVMPVFFIVGGYSNAVSLESAKRKSIVYEDWLNARVNRLVSPLLLLVIVWAALSFILFLFGTQREVIQFASKASLIPIWFLAIYTVIVLLAPFMYSLWRKWGFYSFWTLAGLAILSDFAFFNLGIKWLGWTNYFWVWLAVHHLGFCWRDGRISSPAKLLFYSLVSLALLILLVNEGPYPIAMAGSPGEGVSNSLPPKATLLILGLFQFGFLLSIEKPMQKLLSSLKVWTSVVILNSMIMTVYLWHITVMIIIVSLLYLVGGIGLTIEPGSPIWWSTRPIWIAGLTTVLIPVALALSGLERRGKDSGRKTPSRTRIIAGSICVCLGVATLSMLGFDGNPLMGVDLLGLVLILTGSGLCSIFPKFG